jgi:toxin ParE1/3/4
MNLRWDKRAIQDLHNIRRYIANSSPAAAGRVQQHLRSRILRLPQHPLIGVATSNPEVRVLPATRYPYRIYYSIQNNEIVILHIRHTARRTPDDLGL